MTCGSRRIAAGVPSAILPPLLSTTILSARRMIMSILCSIRHTVRPWSTSLRISAARPTVSSGLTPLAGSSSSSSSGSVESASAKATRLRSSCVMSAAMRLATCERPTKSSASSAFSRHSFSSCRSRCVLASTSHRHDWVRSRWPTIRLSRTVASSNRCVVWKVRAMPKRATWSGRIPVTSWPLNRMRPELGLWVPATRLKKVVLPAPLGPMMALTWPRAKRVLTWSTAVRPKNCLVRATTSSIAPSPLRRLGGGGASRTALEPSADDAVRQEDEQRDQYGAKHHHAVVLQKLQTLREPSHQERAHQRPQQRADAADQGEHDQVEGYGFAGQISSEKAHLPGIQRPGKPGVGQREHKGQGLGAHQINTERFSQFVAVAHCHKAA